jgi:hypothetical protein
MIQICILNPRLERRWGLRFPLYNYHWLVLWLGWVELRFGRWPSIRREP